MMTGFGPPTMAAYARGSKPEKGTGKSGLFISESHLGGDHFQVGDEVTILIVVGNNSNARLTTPTITVSDSLPAGIRNLRASGHDWNITLSDTESPTEITAKYLGNDSVHSGGILPAIKISGKLTKDAIPQLTSIARVHTGCNCDTSNTKTTNTIFVGKEGNNQKCDKCDEGKEHKGCKEREECQKKSSNSTQGENPTNATVSPTPTPTPTTATSSAITVSSVAIATSNTYNIFGGVQGITGLSGAGGTSGLGGIGGAPGSGEAGNIPGLPNTGSDPDARGQ